MDFPMFKKWEEARLFKNQALLSFRACWVTFKKSPQMLWETFIVREELPMCVFICAHTVSNWSEAENLQFFFSSGSKWYLYQESEDIFQPHLPWDTHSRAVVKSPDAEGARRSQALPSGGLRFEARASHLSSASEELTMPVLG